MKPVILLALIAAFSLGGCGTFGGKREIEVVVPPHDNTEHGQFSSESAHKTPDSH